MYQSKQCQCFQGYIWVLGRCIRCGINEENRGLKCYCKPTFYRFRGICACPLNSKLVNGECLCNRNTVLRNGVCVSQNGSPPVVTPFPPTPCPDKSFWNGTYCVCAAPLFMIRGVCEICGPNSLYDQNTLKCNCNAGYYPDPYICLPCHPSCETCFKDGSDGCSSCRNDYRKEGNRCTCYNTIKRGTFNAQGELIVE